MSAPGSPMAPPAVASVGPMSPQAAAESELGYEALVQHIMSTDESTSPSSSQSASSRIRMGSVLSPTSSSRSGLRLSSVYPQLLRPSHHLASTRLTDAPLELKQAGEEDVKVSALYTFPTSPFAGSLEEVTRAPHGTGVLLHSFSQASRQFHDYALTMAALDQQRKEAHAAALQVRQRHAWEGQLMAMMENNTSTDTIELVKRSIMKTRHKDAPDAQTTNAANGTQTGNAHTLSSSESKQSLDDFESPRGRRARGTDGETERSSPSKKRGKVRRGEAEASASPAVIALRRSRQQQKLARAAQQRMRDFYVETRPRNPFTEVRGANEEAATPSSTAPLTVDAQVATQAFQALGITRDIEKKQRRAALEAAADNPEWDPDEPLTVPAVPAEQALLQVSGVPTRVYKPSVHFARETKGLIGTSFYTEPGPSGNMDLDSPYATIGADPENFLRRDRTTTRESKQQLDDIRAGVEETVTTNFRAALGGNAAADRVGTRILNQFLASSRESTLSRTRGQRRVLGQGAGLGAKVDEFRELVETVRFAGMLEESHSAEPPELPADAAARAAGRMPHARKIHASESRQRRMARQGVSDSTDYHHYELTRMVGNNNSSLNARPGAHLTSVDLERLTEEEVAAMERLARSSPCAVRISFRSSRIRVSRLQLLYFFGTMPGCTRIDDILLSPALDEAYIAFQYNRLEHSGAGAGASPEVTGGRAGVECDGVEAVRLHLRIICADTPTPYLAAHRVRASPLGQAGGPVEGLSDEGHGEMRVLLRFLLQSAAVTEWSAVQISAIRARWNKHAMPHVADPNTLGPRETLPKKHAESKQQHPTAPSQPQSTNADASQTTFMSQDTGRMFAPRLNAVDADDGSTNGGGPTGIAVAPRPAAHARRRANKVYPSVPALEWPDGMFAHVERERAQAAAIADPASARLTPTPPPMPSNFLAGVAARGGASGSQSARLNAVSAAVGAAYASYPPPPQTVRVAMPAPGAGTGQPPSSLAVAPTAPPPASQQMTLRSESRGGVRTAVRRRAPAPTLAERSLAREPSLYTAHPSSSAAAPARPHSPSVFVASPRFFRTVGDEAGISAAELRLDHPSAPAPLDAADAASDLARTLAVQHEAMESRHSAERDQTYRSAMRAPVRNKDGLVSARTARRMRNAGLAVNSSPEHRKRVATHLTWSLTSQLEGCAPP